MTIILCIVFFFSGATALIFEALWFNQAGLALGNSVWASSLVLSGFMAGLALGNFLAAREKGRIRNPIAFYAGAELVIGLTGVALIYFLPHTGPFLSQWMGPLVEIPWILNPIRFFLSFLLMMIPATAMGLTLPLLTKALVRYDPSFGSVLGRLYGWNTLGAVLGVVATEIFLVERFGIRTTAMIAGGINLSLAIAAFTLARFSEAGTSFARPERYYLNVWASGKRWLIAGFLSGFCLLALEVVWFRFLLLFIAGLTLSFAMMLAVVLAGIALGGLCASVFLRRWPEVSRLGTPLALGAGLICILSYAIVPHLMNPPPEAPVFNVTGILKLAIPLMFPVSFVSGIFFALIGSGLRAHVESDSAASGALTFANTLGAALGSFAAGFILLPFLGMELSFFLIVLVYGLIGMILLPPLPLSRASAARGGLFVVLVLLLFPFGDMKKIHFQVPVGWNLTPGTGKVAGVREGLVETIIYLEHRWLDRPLYYRLLTNSYSMSGSHLQARRYMKLYAYLPVAVHPDPRSALLISYGVGVTAKALTDTKRLASIDIVDISRDILEMNRIVYPKPEEHPLNDPRVKVHIEDGRYFLQTTDRRFDLITGEPPPPNVAGVVNLYTREYFDLLHSRLAEGGMVTYWLPIHDLSDQSTKAILKAFCGAFSDCSLWHGQGTNLMMVGFRGAAGPAELESFLAQWNDPAVLPEMIDLGFERPEQIGALFIGGPGFIDSFTQGSLPVTDDFPRRIVAPVGSREEMTRLYRLWTDVGAARERFRESPLIARLWPEEMREASLPFFDYQKMVNDHWFQDQAKKDIVPIEDVHRLMTETDLKTPVLWLLGSSGDGQRVLRESAAEQGKNPRYHFHEGIRLLSERNYKEAAKRFRQSESHESLRKKAFRFRVYATAMAGEIDTARTLAREGLANYLDEHFARLEKSGVAVPANYEITLPPFWAWMKTAFEIDPAGDFQRARSRG